MNTYDEKTREFVLDSKLTNLDSVQSYLENYEIKGRVPEIYWAIVKYTAEKLDIPELHKAVKSFRRSLKYPRIDSCEGKVFSSVPAVTPTNTKLKDYQLTAVKNLAAGSMILGDDLGLGKTLCALWAYYQLKLHSPSRWMTVLVPNEEVGDEWMIAYKKHINDPDIKVGMVRGDRSNLSICNTHDIVIVPYYRIWREEFNLHFDRRAREEKHVLVLDEAHRINNTTSTQHQYIAELTRRSPNMLVWALSGTEVSNTPESYLGIYRVVTRSKVSLAQWREYFTTTLTKKNAWNPSRLVHLNVVRKGFALRRTTSDVRMELPPCRTKTLRVPMDPKQKEGYEKLVQEMKLEVATLTEKVKTINVTHVFVLTLRLRQWCSYPGLLDDLEITSTPKLERLLLLLEEAGNQKVIIWSHFPGTIEWLASNIRRNFKDKVVSYVHGGVDKDVRNSIKHDMQGGKLDIVIANPAIWSEGVNLTEATINIYWDWDPSRVKFEQSKKRSHRQGQTKPVFIYYLVHSNSVEEKVLKWLKNKASLAKIITGN